MRRILMIAAFGLLAPAALAGQTQADATAEARMQAAIDHALTVGVPASMLEAKIAEGRAKGVSMARIAAAVEHRAQVLTRVQTAFNARREAVSQSELTAAADAHERGVSVEKITELSAQAGNERSAALTVLADLVARGRAPEHALLRVQAALQGGASELARMRNTELRGNAAAGARVEVGRRKGGS
jgi:hypothetical protein